MSTVDRGPILVDVGGGRLICAQIRGAGPLVVMSGGGAGEAVNVDPALTSLEEAIAEFATVLIYDRAGVGRSDGPFPETITSIVGDLRQLIQSMGLELPAVFTGWSFGGLVAQAYAALHPADVAGLVFIDPTQTSELEVPAAQRIAMERLGRIAAATLHTFAASGILRTSAGRSLIRAMAKSAATDKERELMMRSYTDERRLGDMRRLIARLHHQIEETAGLVRERGLPPVRLTVISAGRRGRMKPSMIDFLRRDHEALAARSPRGRRVVAENSGHLIPLDQPEIIVESIREITERQSASAAADPVAEASSTSG